MKSREISLLLTLIVALLPILSCNADGHVDRLRQPRLNTCQLSVPGCLRDRGRGQHRHLGVLNRKRLYISDDSKREDVRHSSSS